MELRHLRYFLVVAEEQHFTRAAERLGMQQPPLSQQIRILEQELGFELFRRHPKGADLTAGGKVFLEEAKAILHSVDVASQKAARAAQGFAGTISIGFTSSAAAHPLIPGIIRAYRQAYPGVHMALTEANAAELTEDVMHGKVDMGFLRQPVAQPQGIAFHALVEEEMLLILPAGHALLNSAAKRPRRGAGRGDEMPEVSLKALAGEEFILVRRHGAPGMYSNLIAACENAGFTPKIALEIDRMLTNISLVAAGVGISVVPASMKSFHRESVVYCRVKDARPALLAPINLVCRGTPAGPTQQNFLKLAREFSARAGG